MTCWCRKNWQIFLVLIYYLRVTDKKVFIGVVNLSFFDIEDVNLNQIYSFDEVNFLKQLGWSPTDVV